MEVKRSTDTRIRREVVGQMLEYAANAIVYVPAERIRAVFEGQCAATRREPIKVLAEAFGEGTDPDAYWAMVEENVRAHRLRLVFLADLESRPSWSGMVEYLNEQIVHHRGPVVELKEYAVGKSRMLLVPRVIGRTAAAVTKERAPRGTAWTWD